jgi:hypothetical protein
MTTTAPQGAISRTLEGQKALVTGANSGIGGAEDHLHEFGPPRSMRVARTFR